MRKKSYRAYLLILLIIVAAFLAGPFIGRGEPSIRLSGTYCWECMYSIGYCNFQLTTHNSQLTTFLQDQQKGILSP